MRKIFIFMLVLTALCLMVSCGEASDTTVAVTGDTTPAPHTAVTTTEPRITTPKPLTTTKVRITTTNLVTTTPATTSEAVVTSPDTTEDDGMYRAGFWFSGHYEIPYQVIPVCIGYEIPKTCYYQAESVPITIFVGIPSNLINDVNLPADSLIRISLYKEVFGEAYTVEEVYTILDIPFTEIKKYTCTITIDDGKIIYAQEGMTFDLDLSLFEETSGTYLIKAKHLTETDYKWDVVLGVNLRYSHTPAGDYGVFGK